MACRPDEQNRLTVTPHAVTGKPARMAARRATLCPVAPSGKPQPEDDVLDLRRIEPGSLQRFGHHVTCHRCPMGLVESPASRLTDTGASGRNNYGVSHEANI